MVMICAGDNLWFKNQSRITLLAHTFICMTYWSSSLFVSCREAIGPNTPAFRNIKSGFLSFSQTRRDNVEDISDSFWRSTFSWYKLGWVSAPRLLDRPKTWFPAARRTLVKPAPIPLEWPVIRTFLLLNSREPMSYDNSSSGFFFSSLILPSN